MMCSLMMLGARGLPWSRRLLPSPSSPSFSSFAVRCSSSPLCPFPTGSGARFYSASPRAARAARGQRKFVDRCRVVLRGGDGGKGCISHAFLSHKRQKTADGGNGGHGGDVVVRAVDGRSHGGSDSLNLDHYHVNGGRGTNGSGNGKTGRGGATVYLDVPVGTVCREVLYQDEDDMDDIDDECFDLSNDEAGGNAGGAFDVSNDDDDDDDDTERAEEHDEFSDDKQYGRVFDLARVGDEFVAARGGQGGLGNIARDPRKFPRLRQGGSEERAWGADAYDDEDDDFLFSFEEEDAEAPRRESEHHVSGTAGEVVAYDLELKSIADIGLVGYPNAGKSTLLGAVSRARPKVAPYPFTTLHPFVGIVEFRDGFRFSVADIPGLVDGASQNAGLGHAFLRHIERTRVLAYVVDIADPELSAMEPIADVETLQACVDRAMEQLVALRNELDLYAPGLAGRPSVVVANKLDMLDMAALGDGIDVMALLAPLGGCVVDDPRRPSLVVPMSALGAQGSRGLVNSLREILENATTSSS